MHHGLANQYFAEVMGFTGTYTATTQGPKGPKTYSFDWGNGYPGWEGTKNGITPKCNGKAQGCIVRSATRLGRRVVVATMQGTRGAEESAMLDFGFASIFNPDLHGTSGDLGGSDGEALHCIATGAVAAVLPPSLPPRLQLWNANVDTSTLQKMAEASLPGPFPREPAARDVAVTRLAKGDIIMATRTGTVMELSRWQIDAAGGLTLLASGITAGSATTSPSRQTCSSPL